MILTGGDRSTGWDSGESHCPVVGHNSHKEWPGMERN